MPYVRLPKNVNFGAYVMAAQSGRESGLGGKSLHVFFVFTIVARFFMLGAKGIDSGVEWQPE